MNKTLSTYIAPQMRIRIPTFNLMLELPVSNAEVDDEAAKERYNDVESDNKDWGEINNSLW